MFSDVISEGTRKSEKYQCPGVYSDSLPETTNEQQKLANVLDPQRSSQKNDNGLSQRNANDNEEAGKKNRGLLSPG